MPGDWANDLCGCFGNCGICIVTFIAPCYTAGKNAEANGESCCLYGFLSILGCIGLWSRSKIRGQTREAKGIDGSYVNDLLMTWFCGPCALVQERREWEEGGQGIARE